MTPKKGDIIKVQPLRVKMPKEEKKKRKDPDALIELRWS